MKCLINNNGIQEIPENEIEAVEVAISLQKANGNFDKCLDAYTEMYERIGMVEEGIKNNDLRLFSRGIYLLEGRISIHWDLDYFLKEKVIKYSGNGGSIYPLVRELKEILAKEIRKSPYATKKYGLKYL